MSMPAPAERVQTREIVNPLDHIAPTLERLGVEDDGEFHYCARTIDTTGGDFISLMRFGAETAVSLYARPVLAMAPNGSRQWLVRNQTLLRTPSDDLLLVTGDVFKCQSGGNHPLGITTVQLSEVGNESAFGQATTDEYYALLTHFQAVMDKIHPDSWISEEGVQNRLGTACRHGGACLHIAFD